MVQKNLEQIIRERIERSGPIPFETFMDMLLYQPEFGYYMNRETRIGAKGDFYTSPHLHFIFGWILAVQLDEMRRMIKGAEDFTILELGAGRGYLARDIIDFIQKKLNWKGNFKYIIIEKNPHTVLDQKNRLKPYDGLVEWKTGIDAAGPFCGCVISNELMDAFPVRMIHVTDQYQEIFVGTDKTGFKEIYGDPSTAELLEYIEQYRLPKVNGYRTEVNLRIKDYLKAISNILMEGFIVSIDYGYSSSQYYAVERNRGTLLCYYQHETNDNPYINIGKQDITAHVNFTSLKDWGEELGFSAMGYSPQGPFLLSLGIDEIVSNELAAGRLSQNELMKIKNLLFDIGETHQVMIQHKGEGTVNTLSGFNISNRLHRL